MGEGACQLDISERPSWGHELTSEAIPISIGGPKPKIHSKVLNIFSMYGIVRIGEKMLSTFLHSSWERGRVNLIFHTDFVGGMN